MARPKTFDKIAAFYREMIVTGQFEEGKKLPSNTALAEEWGVATATVRQALSQLQVEGLVLTTPRGTFVAGANVSPSGLDRMHRVNLLGSALAEGETTRVTAAGIVQAPLYVAEIFDLGDDHSIIRREYVIGKGSQRLALAVSWYPKEFETVPGILSTESGQVATMLQAIIGHTGRKPTGGRDEMHARDTDAREASHLGLKVGDPTLALVSRMWDKDGIIDYTERCLPPRQTIGYEYTLSPTS